MEKNVGMRLLYPSYIIQCTFILTNYNIKQNKVSSGSICSKRPSTQSLAQKNNWILINCLRNCPFSCFNIRSLTFWGYYRVWYTIILHGCFPRTRNAQSSGKSLAFHNENSPSSEQPNSFTTVEMFLSTETPEF